MPTPTPAALAAFDIRIAQDPTRRRPFVGIVFEVATGREVARTGACTADYDAHRKACDKLIEVVNARPARIVLETFATHAAVRFGGQVRRFDGPGFAQAARAFAAAQR